MSEDGAVAIGRFNRFRLPEIEPHAERIPPAEVRRCRPNAGSNGSQTMEIIRNVALISINETMIVVLISFLVFIFILNRVMLRPLRSTMHERDTYLENLRVRMTEAEQTIEQLTRQIRAEEQAAVESAQGVRVQIEKSGQEEAHDIIMAARQDVQAQMESNRVKMNEQINSAQQSIQTEAEGLAVRIMEKMLDRRVSQ
jgi:F-type H+-transporting ATPase subunit b